MLSSLLKGAAAGGSLISQMERMTRFRDKEAIILKEKQKKEDDVETESKGS